MAIDTLLSTAHLRREIGEGSFGALISSDNTELVGEFAWHLAKIRTLTEISVGGYGLSILPFSEFFLSKFLPNKQFELVRSNQQSGFSGKKESQLLLDHQQNIPDSYWVIRTVFIFADERHPQDSSIFWGVYLRRGQWVGDWVRSDSSWRKYFRVLLRKE